MALFGRGSYVSERKAKIYQYIQEGIGRWEATIRAQDEVTARKGGIDSDLVVVDVLVRRCFSESNMTRKTAAIAIGDVLQSAQSKGDYRAMQVHPNHISLVNAFKGDSCAMQFPLMT